jgi:PAS domain S-box-containing protein
VEGVFAAARDITKRKNAENALRESEGRYRSLVTATAQVIWTTNATGEVFCDMPSWRSFTGLTYEQLQGWGWLDSLHPDDRKRTAEIWRRAVTSRALYETEYRLRRYDGEYRHVGVRGVPVTDENGDIREWVGVCTDITDRKRAELELRESEEAFRTLAALVPQMVWMCTPGGLNVYFNQRWVEYTGLTLQESYGRGWNTPFHPDDKQPAWNAWNKAVATGETYAIESRLRGKDGTYRWFLMRGVPLRDGSGNIIKWFGTCTDIHDLKEAQAELKQLNQELEQRVLHRTAQLQATNQELEAFTYSVSHDLRAPLRHISGFSKILSEDFSSALPEEARHLVDRIGEGTRRMGMLVDDLLNLGRIGRHEVRLQVTGLDSVVSDVLRELQPETDKRNVQWKIGRLPYVECDPPLLRQVFQNLLSNALKFTRPREKAIIEVGQEIRDGVSVVFVRDNGVGFSMKYADKLFGVFQRLHRSEDFEGTGVGLATVERIIRKHGGKIWAEAELDKGAIFYFTLGKSEEVSQKCPAGKSENIHELTRG